MPLQCLRSMPRQHVRPFVDSSIVEATSAIAAAGRAGAWHFVVDVLHRARSTGLELDSAIFNSAASAVRRSQHWAAATQLAWRSMIVCTQGVVLLTLPGVKLLGERLVGTG
ncbi:unnamed protein product [Polarella glacialis]|uniref:Uncharacterized protein n=1 Tax=Polarella glacialis TaxID=89957 RepID=A0A813JAM9_POLGL|nr:unnamed protein product [Polarella glacialis]